MVIKIKTARMIGFAFVIVGVLLMTLFSSGFASKLTGQEIIYAPNDCTLKVHVTDQDGLPVKNHEVIVDNIGSTDWNANYFAITDSTGWVIFSVRWNTLGFGYRVATCHPVGTGDARKLDSAWSSPVIFTGAGQEKSVELTMYLQKVTPTETTIISTTTGTTTTIITTTTGTDFTVTTTTTIVETGRAEMDIAGVIASIILMTFGLVIVIRPKVIM